MSDQPHRAAAAAAGPTPPVQPGPVGRPEPRGGRRTVTPTPPTAGPGGSARARTRACSRAKRRRAGRRGAGCRSPRSGCGQAQRQARLDGVAVWARSRRSVHGVIPLVFKCLGQCMDRPRTVGLDTALRATHHLCRLGHIEFFPVTQQEGFALTRRQCGDLGIDELQDLCPGNGVRGALGAQRVFQRLQSFQQVEVAVLVPGSKSERFCTTALRTFSRRNQSIVAFDRMRWKTSGNSAAGRSAYFSARRIIASCTMSSAASSLRTA